MCKKRGHRGGWRLPEQKSRTHKEDVRNRAIGGGRLRKKRAARDRVQAIFNNSLYYTIYFAYPHGVGEMRGRLLYSLLVLQSDYYESTHPLVDGSSRLFFD